MDNKFNKWTITIIDENGNHNMMEFDFKNEVLEELKVLQESGQNMDDVNIFPPSSNLTLEQVLSY